MINHSSSEIATFIKKVNSFLLVARNELEAFGHGRHVSANVKSNIRIAKFIHQAWSIINHDSNLMRGIADHSTVICGV